MADSRVVVTGPGRCASPGPSYPDYPLPTTHFLDRIHRTYPFPNPAARGIIRGEPVAGADATSIQIRRSISDELQDAAGPRLPRGGGRQAGGDLGEAEEAGRGRRPPGV